MAKVTFRNILEEDSIFKLTDKEYLIPAIYEYARSCDEEIYKLIMAERVLLFVNNEYVEIENWATYKLEEADEIIVTPEVGGGKLGGFLMIALGVVLMAFGQPIGKLFTDAGFAISAGSVAMFGLALALGGISSLLFRPDLPSMPSISDRSSQTYNWSGIKTMARCDIPVPIVYGTHKVGGNVISLFTEVKGGDNYLNMLLALCEGEIEGICTYYNLASVCTTSDSMDTNYRVPAIDLDDQPLHYFSDVKWWYRTGTNVASPLLGEYDPTVQNIIPYFDAARAQYDDGREIISNGINYTTTKEVDAVTIHLYIPALYDSISVPGEISTSSVSYQIYYKKNSDPTWTSFSPDVWGTPTWVNQNNHYSSSKMQVDFSRAGDFIDPTISTSISIEILHITPEEYFESMHGPVKRERTVTYHLKDIKNNTSVQGTTKIIYQYTHYMVYDWESSTNTVIYGPEEWVYSSFSYMDFIITLKQDVVVGDIYTITTPIISGEAIQTVTAKTKTGLWRSHTLDFLNLTGAGSKDSYDIKLVRAYGDKSSSVGIENNLLFNSIIEIVQGGFIYPNTALLGLRIRATGQFSGSPPNVTTLVRGMKVEVPDIEDAAPTGTAVSFDKVYWENDQWETVLGTELYWNDTTSWRTEYSDNSMLCTRDLVLSARYGIGNFIDSSDLYTTGITSVIRECHVPWDPTAVDYFDWWNATSNEEFNLFISGRTGSHPTINSTTREVTATLSSAAGSYSYIHIYFKFSTPLTFGERYKIDLDITTTGNLKLTHYVGPYAFPDTGFIQIGESRQVVTGTVATTFDAPQSGLNYYSLLIRRETNVTVNVNVAITDLSMERATTKKLHYHTYNGVLESGQSALIALLEMCDSFRTWPVWYDGKFNFVIDTDTTPVHTLTRSNTESFSQTFTPLSEIPYRLLGQYTDEGLKYDMVSLIAKSASTSLTKANEKTIGLKGITNRKRAERELKWKLNKVTNCVHTVSVKLGLDAIHATAGDIITIQDDLPQWGYGGRVLSYSVAASTLSLSDYITIADTTADNAIKYQTSDNSFVTASIDTAGLVNGDSVRDITVVSFPAKLPKSDAVYAAGEYGTMTKKFRLLAVNRTSDDMAEFSALEHDSDLYTTEPVITIIEDTHSQLPNPLARPSPPESVSVELLPKEEGIGFIFGVKVPNDGTGIIDTIVKIKKSSEDFNSFEIASVIPVHTSSAKYINNNLEIGETYTISFECRNMTKVSSPVYATVSIEEFAYKPPSPSGIRLKNVDQNSQTFRGKDITIEWNTVSGAYDYVIEVYHTSVSSSNILRTTFVRSESFTYSYENMLEDSGGTIYGVEASKIFFRIAARHISGIESSFSLAFPVYNLVPSDVSGMVAYPLVGGVQFGWDENDDPDHRYYKYNIKVGSGVWGSDTLIEDNTVVQTLTATDIDSYNNKATISCRVKNVDWFEQSSTSWVETSASANHISDNLFQVFITSSNGVGTLASLLDGTYTSGGITIA